MKREFKTNTFDFNFTPESSLELAKKEYIKRYPSEIEPFNLCIIYLVKEKDNSIRLDFSFNQIIEFDIIHKRPKGALIGEKITNIDIREICNINIPKYQDKYYFDFIFFIYDFTTKTYWSTNLWTKEICPDIRFYKTIERKNKYKIIGKKLAENYNKTTFLGHVNLKDLKLKKSIGISRLINNGWIPTISLFPQPYSEMIRQTEDLNNMDNVNEFICEMFEKNKLLEKMVVRWKCASLSNKIINILEICVKNFQNKDYISTIYVLLPQIEGLITEHIKRKKIIPKSYLKERFIQFGEIIVNESFNTEMTKYLTNIFVKNIHKTYFKTWYPYIHKRKKYTGSSITPQRNIIVHGKVKEIYFTEENCLKLFCIIDNIILLSLLKTELKKPNK